jgi:hypothetical protein
MGGYGAPAPKTGRKFKKEYAAPVYLAVFERVGLQPGTAYLDAGCAVLRS